MCGRSTGRTPLDPASSEWRAITSGGRRSATSDRSPASAAPAGKPHLRTSDGERDQAVNQLREHAAAGRLTTEELAARVETALAARTRGELEALLADLPAAPRREPSRAHAKVLGARVHLGAYLWVSLAMIVIWAATGAGYFWPMWPMLGWGIGVVSHSRASGLGPRLARRGH